MCQAKSKDNHDSYHARLEINLAEYRFITKDILRRLSFLQKYISYELISLGAMSTIVASLLTLPPKPFNTEVIMRYFLLLSPLLFFFFFLSVVREYRMVARNIVYMHSHLRPRLTKLALTNDLLTWEIYLTQWRKKYERKRTAMEALGTSTGLPLICAFLLIIVYSLYYLHQDVTSHLDITSHFNKNGVLNKYTYYYIIYFLDIGTFIYCIIKGQKVNKYYKFFLGDPPSIISQQ